MSIPEQDTPLVEYARRQGLPWYYTDGEAAEKPRLTLHHGCVTATFEQGRLVELRADANHDLFDVMFENFSRLFALSAAATSSHSGKQPNVGAHDCA